MNFKFVMNCGEREKEGRMGALGPSNIPQAHEKQSKNCSFTV